MMLALLQELPQRFRLLLCLLRSETVLRRTVAGYEG